MNRDEMERNGRILGQFLSLMLLSLHGSVRLKYTSGLFLGILFFFKLFLGILMYISGCIFRQ